MRDRKDENSQARRSTWGDGLRIAIPLVLALVLAGAFVVLLAIQASNSREASGPTASSEKPSLIHVAPEEIPYGSPTDSDPFKWPETPRERFGGDFPRWNLKEFPPGWNQKLAKEIHSYFESMTLDLKDEEKLARLGKIREGFSEFLAKLGPESLPTLGAILNAEGDFVNRRFLLYAIGNLGPQSESATFMLRDFFVARQADPRNQSEIYHVIEAMKALQNDTSFSTLSDFVENPAFEDHRDKFVEALGDHRKRDAAVSTFVECMRADDDTRVRNKAAQALGKVRNPETLNELYAAVEKERFWGTKQTILGTIGKIGNPNSIPFLEDKARNSPESEVRLSAAGALRRIDTPYAWQVLRELQQLEPRESLRARIAQWVEEQQGQAK